MLPTSRRDRYDNAKGRRGGVLRTLLRKEGRLIRQLLIFVLLLVVLLLLFRWWPIGQALPKSTPQEELDNSQPEKEVSTSKPTSADDVIPRFSLGGKRFLPQTEASEDSDKSDDENLVLSEGGGTDPWSVPAEQSEHLRKEAGAAEVDRLLSGSDEEDVSQRTEEQDADGTEKRTEQVDTLEHKGLEAGVLRGQTDRYRRHMDKKKRTDLRGTFLEEDEGKGENADGHTKLSDTGGLIQTSTEDGASSESEGKSDHQLAATWEKKRQQVVAAFQNAWGAYKKHAWGYDELKPVSQQGEDGLGGLGATIVDALDTAMIMGLGDIVEDAGNWIDQELPSKLAHQGYVNLFETTIRVLGGLLSAYHLSGGEGADLTLAGGAIKAQGRGPPPEVYLKRAEDLGERLMAAFSSPSEVPYSDVHLADTTAKAAQFDGGSSSTAEVSTLGMEFCYLSRLTQNPKYCDAALGVVKHIKKQHSVDGLVPIFISPLSGHFDGNNIRLGSRGDSYYEYLLKVWMQGGGAEEGSAHSDVQWLREMWDEAMGGVKSRLLGTSVPSGLLFVGERPDGLRAELSPKMDHLVCFLAGALALGATKGRTLEEARLAGDFSERDKEDLRIAKELAHTCYAMYEVTVTGLAPEIAYFNVGGGVHGMPPGNPKSKYLEDIMIQPLDRHNLLRPETVESLFVLHRITGDDQYREWGWEIFTSLELHAKVATGGYSSLHDVTKIPPPTRDKMETFFLGETLKYLYLLFSDRDVLPLDKFVFNTEAHPLPVWSSSSGASVGRHRSQIAQEHRRRHEDE